MKTVIKGVASSAAAAWMLAASAQPAAAKVHPIEVLLQKESGKCVHAADVRRMRIRKSKDLIVLDVSNYGDPDKAKDECGMPQDVLFCTYNGAAWSRDIFEPCASVPSGRDLNAPFTLQPREIVRLMCLAKTTGQDRQMLLFSGQPGSLKCPETPPEPQKSLHHQIAIEIVP